MTENQNQPREYDAVLGGKNPPPINAAVLGGIEGVKRRLTAADELVRVGAVREAMKYGEAGLDVAIASLKDKSRKVRRAAISLLQEKLTHPKVQPLLTNGKLIVIYREEFETVTISARAEIIKRERHQAEMFAEHLGDGVELEMVSLPGGSFLMGLPIESRYSPEIEREGPQHRVNVPPFFIGKYPVTQKQYEAVMGNNPSYFKGANRPVEKVTWNDATDFCWLLSQKTGKNYRLPSEAEWEYACRAGTTTLFYFGPAITTEFANYRGNTYMADYYKNIARYRHFYEPYAYDSAFCRGQTTDVGSFPPNAFGLYDMHGNVGEWCQDVWHKNYHGAPTDGSAWESGGNSDKRVWRSGSWEDYAWDCHSAHRDLYTYPPLFTGFRVVLDPDL